MGKVSTDARKRYLDTINEYKKVIEEIEHREAMILQVLAKDPAGIEYKRLRLADDNLNLISYYILMNDLSLSLLGVKNEPYLNNARKICYKVVIYLEQNVTNLIDAPFADYADKLQTIDGFDFKQRYQLLNKVGFAIQSVVDGFGDNTKWKWSFVELEGRFATVVKNMINLKTLYTDLDPMSEGFDIRQAHFNLAKRLLEQSATRYREKYELSTLRFDDFRIGIKYLGALRLLHIAVNRPTEAENIKKKMEIWNQKLENDLKKKDIASKQ